MQQNRVTRHFWLAVSALSMMLLAEVIFLATPAGSGALQAASQNGQFSGRVVSASGAMVPGGPAVNPGHPVAGIDPP